MEAPNCTSVNVNGVNY